MTDFANYIIDEALYWLRQDCKEHSNTPNQSICVNEIKGRVTNEDWCALFAYRCVLDAAKKSGAKNLLKHTPSTRTMLAAARQAGIRVDSTPALGAVFFRPREATTGHVGIVCGLNQRDVITIEGNVSNRVGLKWYYRTNIQHYVYIHIQDQASQKWTKAPYNLRPTSVRHDARNAANPLKTESSTMMTGAILGLAGVLGYILYNELE
jgi:hypothetical protein